MIEKWEIALEVFAGSSEAHPQFRERFRTEITEFIDKFYQAYLEYLATPVSVRLKGYGFSDNFIFNSFHCLLTSMNLLVSGLPAPSGGLVRSYCESLSWSLLCSARKLKYAHSLVQNEGQFDGQEAINHLNKEENVRELDLDKAGVGTIRELAKLMHKYSHVSHLSLTTIRTKGKRFIGGFFNPHMVKYAYPKELETRIWGCRIIRDALENVIVPKLSEWPDDKDS